MGATAGGTGTNPITEAFMSKAVAQVSCAAGITPLLSLDDWEDGYTSKGRERRGDGEQISEGHIYLGTS